MHTSAAVLFLRPRMLGTQTRGRPKLRKTPKQSLAGIIEENGSFSVAEAVDTLLDICEVLSRPMNRGFRVDTLDTDAVRLVWPSPPGQRRIELAPADAPPTSSEDPARAEIRTMATLLLCMLAGAPREDGLLSGMRLVDMRQAFESLAAVPATLATLVDSCLAGDARAPLSLDDLAERVASFASAPAERFARLAQRRAELERERIRMSRIDQENALDRLDRAAAIRQIDPEGYQRRQRVQRNDVSLFDEDDIATHIAIDPLPPSERTLPIAPAAGAAPREATVEVADGVDVEDEGSGPVAPLFPTSSVRPPPNSSLEGSERSEHVLAAGDLASVEELPETDLEVEVQSSRLPDVESVGETEIMDARPLRQAIGHATAVPTPMPPSYSHASLDFVIAAPPSLPSAAPPARLVDPTPSVIVAERAPASAAAAPVATAPVAVSAPVAAPAAPSAPAPLDPFDAIGRVEDRGIPALAEAGATAVLAALPASTSLPVAPVSQLAVSHAGHIAHPAPVSHAAPVSHVAHAPVAVRAEPPASVASLPLSASLGMPIAPATSAPPPAMHGASLAPVAMSEALPPSLVATVSVPPRSSRHVFTALIGVAALACIGLGLFAGSRLMQASAPSSAASPPAVAERLPEPAVVKPADVKPVDAKPADVKPAVKAADLKPAFASGATGTSEKVMTPSSLPDAPVGRAAAPTRPGTGTAPTGATPAGEAPVMTPNSLPDAKPRRSWSRSSAKPASAMPAEAPSYKTID